MYSGRCLVCKYGCSEQLQGGEAGGGSSEVVESSSVGEDWLVDSDVMMVCKSGLRENCGISRMTSTSPDCLQTF
jgi:hypothetical protein